MALVLTLPVFSADVPKPEAMEEPPATQPVPPQGYRVRYTLLVAGDPKTQKAESIIASLPTGGWLRSDGSDVLVQDSGGHTIPVTVLSYNTTGDEMIQFKRHFNDRYYWVYAANSGAPAASGKPFSEGLTVEFRDWAGDRLDSWTSVVEGLRKSDNVIANAVVQDVSHNTNPGRPTDPRNFAASYRGFLNITKAGPYRFLANADDAAFLFIDGYKVYERTGSNLRFATKIPTRGVAKDIDLTVGIHPFEVHHVMGNSPSAVGTCDLLWIPPDTAPPSPGAAPNFARVPRENFVQAMAATPAAIEPASGGGDTAAFAWGIDDVLVSGGLTTFLVRFEAQGTFKDPSHLVWDMGDGTTRTGASVRHVYFRGGSYNITLKSDSGLSPFKRNIYLWPTPVTSSPLSLTRAVKALSDSNWKKFDAAKIDQTFSFLRICNVPERWPLVEGVCRHLLDRKDQDPQTRALAYASLMEAVAQQGHARDALKLVDTAMGELAKLPAQQVVVQLAAAAIDYDQLKEPDEAAKIYEKITSDNRRLDVPEIRLAAVRWGDMLADTGNLPRAAEAYRLASTLGNDDSGAGGGGGDAATRGALLRVAEQKLRSGDVSQTAHLLEQIETKYPEQKLEGLYRFLRAESDRYGGRYEQATRNYEVLLRLAQWASYRDRAVYGLVDTYFRMGEMGRALDWLEELKHDYPAYYKQQKGDEFQKIIEERLSKAQALHLAQTRPSIDPDKLKALLPFTGFRTGFEPQEHQAFATTKSFMVAHALGFEGPHVGYCLNYPVQGGFTDYSLSLRNVTPGGYYWVEFWYRETLMPMGAGAHCYCWFYGTGNVLDPAMGQGLTYIDRTYGQWRKVGFRSRAPLTNDGHVDLSLRYWGGIVQLDGLEILPVSDQQNDSLNSYIEGGETP